MDNYYELFDLPITFALNKDVLKRKFYKVSRSSHPDLFAQASDEEKASAEQHYSEINQAYELLSDDLPRIKYTLELLGMSLNDKEQLDTEFLMEMMDINERIEELHQSVDNIIDHAIMDEIKTFEVQLKKQYEIALNDYESDSFNKTILDTIKDYYLKSKYLLRIKENISTFAPEM